MIKFFDSNVHLHNYKLDLKDNKVHNVLKNYQYAKERFEKDNRIIFNATAGGKLELFDRVDYNKLF